MRCNRSLCLGLVVAIVMCIVAGCQQPDRINSRPPSGEATAPKAQRITRFDIEWSDYEVDTVDIPHNTALSVFLAEQGVPAAKLNQLPSGLQGVFPVRSIRAGRPTYLFRAQDSSLAYWVYSHTPSVYLKIDLQGDSLHATLDTLATTRTVRLLHATIESSLWNAMVQAGAKPEVALALSDIFAWTGDFFALGKGDQFYAVYEQESLDSVPIGIGTIFTARYVSDRKDTVAAYRFEQNGAYSYWDARGNSLRRAFLKAPLKFSRISSHFSYARMHPILHTVRAHTGVDYAAPAGTPVMALGDGTVIERGYKGGGGNTVKIRHNSVYTTAYLHLKGFAKGVAPGVRVAQGQVIGYVGSTGMATGPHLDFRVWMNGKPVNPLTLKSPSVEPIGSENREAFQREVQRQDSLLASYGGVGGCSRYSPVSLGTC